MPVGDYLILVQNVLLVLTIGGSAWIFCKKKPKPDPVSKPSNETLMVKSAIKPPITDLTPSAMGAPKDEKKEEETKDEKKEEGAKKAGGGAKDPSMKPFPKFEMPTESKKKKKQPETNEEKQEKIRNGFYQEKSDNDDTLEKIDSLKIEQSDRTKRSQKNKKK